MERGAVEAFQRGEEVAQVVVLRLSPLFDGLIALLESAILVIELLKGVEDLAGLGHLIEFVIEGTDVLHGYLQNSWVQGARLRPLCL